MSTVSQIMIRVALRLNDMYNGTFSTYELLEHINEANRLMLKTVAKNKPSLMAKSLTGAVTAGNNVITLTEKPIKIIEIRIDGKVITNVQRNDIADLTVTGTPTGYYSSGLGQTFSLHPIPIANSTYDVYGVYESTLLDETMDSGWSIEFEDAIIDFATLRANSQEPETRTFADVLQQQTLEIIQGMEPKRLQVRSCWEGVGRRDGYRYRSQS